MLAWLGTATIPVVLLRSAKVWLSGAIFVTPVANPAVSVQLTLVDTAAAGGHSVEDRPEGGCQTSGAQGGEPRDPEPGQNLSRPDDPHHGVSPWFLFLLTFPGYVSWLLFLVTLPGYVSWLLFLVL
jgi:hypothetical protein